MAWTTWRDQAAVSEKKLLRVKVVMDFGGDKVERSWLEFMTKQLIQLGTGVNSDIPDVRDYSRERLKGIAQELYELKMELYVQRLQLSEAGKKGAEKRWRGIGLSDSDNGVRNIIAALAIKIDGWGGYLTSKELWPEFYSKLDEAGLNPKEDGRPNIDDGSWIIWDGHPNHMTFRVFKNKLSIARGLVEK